MGGGGGERVEDSIEVSIRNSVICVQRKCAKGGGGVSAQLGFLFISFLNWSVLFTFMYRKLFFFTENTGKSPCS